MLNCSPHEANLLRDMVYFYMESEGDIEIDMFLEKCYFARGFETLPYLKEIKRLIDLGWLRTINRIESSLELKNNIVTLGNNLLKILDDGQILTSPIKEKEYKNSLEYLQDEWEYINLVLQRNKTPSIALNSHLSSSCNSYIDNLEQIITKNLTNNKKKFKILEYFSKNNFNKYEKSIFLLLAQAQYKGAYGLCLQDIILLGSSEEEKITIQNLLSQKSRLLKDGFVQLADSYVDFSFMEQEFCIPQNVLDSLIFEKNVSKNKLEDEVERSEIFELITPKKGLDSVILPADLRERFEILLQHLDPKVHKRLRAWGIKENAGIDSKILLFGDSGTGKTSAAHALAKDLKQKILSLDCSKILSMYVGESEKNVRKIFDEYRIITQRVGQKPILLLDEADQLLGTRSDVASSASRMYHQMQNIFLEQIEKFDGILIATTNLVDSLDSAFSRRFHYKIKFLKPDFKSRVKIWNLHLPKNAEFVESPAVLAETLASFELSGGQIKLIIENTCYKVATRANPTFSKADFEEEIAKELKGEFGGDKKLGFL
ncbi:AAA family ATPase [Helicobacter saguini]|uniref:AAA family ATPase n=2 Tax=Helicobacter saguini TaxID=1548018 RepID=A0A347VM90_9HELI|nr:ATP-binding protein [Helicobacter saguini]MWV62360.1 AAA family ATPase [Helicobacter saguini]MWV66968.1 AAA family ATPase [Helicobacter saguini]MWV69316.1 AAA family ATPase [Helicobacter saguini]MWV71128.1 AAA family ATPase [Helicobacter saguini]TLD95077.1 ATP-binding protein [Helicobacter saguini]